MTYGLGKGNKMKQITNEKAEELKDYLEELENSFSDMIVDLHGQKGYAQARIAYIYYRRLVWNAKHIIQNDIKDTKK